jgi:hypothetical protein
MGNGEVEYELTRPQRALSFDGQPAGRSGAIRAG